MQSRQSIRRTTRQFPAARIVVTGCYAQVGQKEIASIAGVDTIVGHAQKLAVEQWLPLSQDSPATVPVLPQTPRQPAGFAPLSSAAGQQPRTKDVAFTNLCDLAVVVRKGSRVVATSAIDNLMKGAASQAVQNMNCMFGLPETMGLAM